MVREDLISSAVSFLQDPSVAASPLDKRKAFLESKNLTQEEIDIALARTGETISSSSPAAYPPQTQSNYPYPNQQVSRQSPSNGYGYNYGPYQGPWGPMSSPEPPRRDWRDWFIMATVTTGVGYGLYVAAKRYVMPLIAPPTPPQLEQDKSEIDESFNRAFALIEQLATDTEALKTAETERTEKLDKALQEVESVVSDLKASGKRREEDGRRMGDEVRALKEMIPKALEGWKADGDGRLKDLGNELKSLKMLVGNRVGGAARPAQFERSAGSGSSTPREGLPQSMTVSSTASNENSDDRTSSTIQPPSSSASAPGINAPRGEASSPFGLDGKPPSRAAIPAWQMAAAGTKRKESASPSVINREGTMSDGTS